MNRKKKIDVHHELCVCLSYSYIWWLTTDFKLNSDKIFHNETECAVTKNVLLGYTTVGTPFSRHMLGWGNTILGAHHEICDVSMLALFLPLVKIIGLHIM